MFIFRLICKHWNSKLLKGNGWKSKKKDEAKLLVGLHAHVINFLCNLNAQCEWEAFRSYSNKNLLAFKYPVHTKLVYKNIGQNIETFSITAAFLSSVGLLSKLPVVMSKKIIISTISTYFSWKSHGNEVIH